MSFLLKEGGFESVFRACCMGDIWRGQASLHGLPLRDTGSLGGMRASRAQVRWWCRGTGNRPSLGGKD
jgi:hypothetical protein